MCGCWVLVSETEFVRRDTEVMEWCCTLSRDRIGLVAIFLLTYYHALTSINFFYLLKQYHFLCSFVFRTFLCGLVLDGGFAFLFFVSCQVHVTTKTNVIYLWNNKLLRKFP